ncbi:Hsp20/alpha crystallin family protein [Ancylomarina euxinus]|uniref:Hsp20/alpha crystallin family protein n=1 Tax=Ancylomarina euxinus TaxID=2283627 RepID=A0A425XX69_9BACT|nr:Hsp20/alpha crystallin family protein [Ancylomarina euxinus]MCZ4696188.1 Hsp20/alpha crystallin family protein [Ancylomarina euxinus]MUP16448.1 Hsp20 family protein [Ancylomarina euxinus]RRG19237.1 Hsp20/alpha crystallin family protein [Ancylomarina euxinus]
MTLVKRNSDNSFPSLFDNFFSRDWMDWNNSNYSSTNTTLPAVNVRENDHEFTIEVAAPGMKKDDFNIHLENNQLSISSEIKSEKESKDGKYSRKEFSYQSFQRSFRLPVDLIDGDKISAKYNEGILSIHLPKKEEAKPKPSRMISIK